VKGAGGGVEIIDALSLEAYEYLHSSRADLLCRLGRTDEAPKAYPRALELTRAESARRFLARRP
jgi:RNA polymerase sigma-70 factor, ECF subfamily